MSSLLAQLPLSSRIALSSPARLAICTQCRRSFTASAILASGHNKWSKIKHEKAAADKKKTARRSSFAKQLSMYSKMSGADPALNTQLASVISIAKKAGMPKAAIDAAIARGQGKSETGASLETATLEAMLSSTVAMVIDIESDNKQRSLKDLRVIVKKCGGVITPTAFHFARRGRIILGDDHDDDADKQKKKVEYDFDDVMMKALDAGAEDVEKDDEDNVVVWTPPNMTHQVVQSLAKTSGLHTLSTDIIWAAAGDKVKVDDPEAVALLAKCIAKIRENPDAQGVFINAERGDDIPEEDWHPVEEALESFDS
ncbi:duf28 domain-containing protein [Xylaria sp. CBS 124048]|nr:duf28 domain-containing protein [Xylaria sp. CBS 124048]